jgi:hypothetical protein
MAVNQKNKVCYSVWVVEQKNEFGEWEPTRDIVLSESQVAKILDWYRENTNFRLRKYTAAPE